MSQYVEGPEAGLVIEDRAQLTEYFFDAAKPREEWRIGTEYEMLGVSRRSGRAARYAGPRGIERILHRLADSLEWEPQEEEGHVIALQGERANIALEPGAQVELSGEQCKTVHCAVPDAATLETSGRSHIDAVYHALQKAGYRLSKE